MSTAKLESSSSIPFFPHLVEAQIAKQFENSLKNGRIDLLLEKENTSILIKEPESNAAAFEVLSPYPLVF